MHPKGLTFKNINKIKKTSFSGLFYLFRYSIDLNLTTDLEDKYRLETAIWLNLWR